MVERFGVCVGGGGRGGGEGTLFMATMMGTLAARAWLMASRVCGRTPSSAATTMMAMSVTLAPRALMAVNACKIAHVHLREGHQEW